MRDGTASVAALPEIERKALLVMACFDATRLTRSRALDLARDADIRVPASAVQERRGQPGALLAHAAFKEYFERWLNDGLIREKHGYFCCAPDAAHGVLSDPSLKPLLVAVRDRLLNGLGSSFRSVGYSERAIAIARASLYLGGDEAKLVSALEGREPYARHEGDPYLQLLSLDAPAAALRRLPPGVLAAWLGRASRAWFSELIVPRRDVIGLLIAAEAQPRSRAAAAMLMAAGDEPAKAAVLIGHGESAVELEARAFCELCQGEVARARQSLRSAFEASRGPQQRRKPSLESPLAPLLTVVLATGEPADQAIAREQAARHQRGQLTFAYHDVTLLLAGAPVPLRPTHSQLDLLMNGFLAALDGATLSRSTLGFDDEEVDRVPTGAGLWSREAAAVARALRGKPAGSSVLFGLKRQQAAWERALDRVEALCRLAPPSIANDKTSAGDERLAFFVRIHEPNDWESTVGAHLVCADYDPELLQSSSPTTSRRRGPRLSIEARVQASRGAGWNAGRSLAPRTLAKRAPDLECLSEEDRRVIARFGAATPGLGNDYYYTPRAALALVGHPRVFWHDRPQGAPIDVIERAPSLYVEKKRGEITVRIEPIASESGLGVLRDERDRLVLSYLLPEPRAVQNALLELPAIPAQGEPRLRAMIGRLSSAFTVQSHVGIDGEAGQVETITADPRPVVRLWRAEPGLRVMVNVCPLGLEGPTWKVGKGSPAIAAEIGGRRVRCERDLAAERSALEALVAAAPDLGGALDLPVTIDRLEACLSVLQTLEGLGDAVIVRWPGGSPVAVIDGAAGSRLSLALEEVGGDWLSASGELRVSEDEVLALGEALARRLPSGRFIALGPDRYLALSEEQSGQLAALEAATRIAATEDEGPGPKTLRLPPIALGFVSPWLRSLRTSGALSIGAKVDAQLARIEHAYDHEPALPKALAAELRSYQVNGFQFLSRLAEIGAGACLADDMGLGKTLMTLALLLQRGALGPALVVVPLSVRANWLEEIVRFAPVLRARSIDQVTSELDALEPFDVVICSYTVMAQRVEQLEARRWATLVLDEAQAIKNASTQRSRAARRLVADARVALTGTPVENHLGDLHAIMAFLNPGLLGTAKQFEARFAKPIQREGDARAAELLRALMAPFVLRRRKAEVLRELPPRTEITLRIEAEASERAFNEALRRAALSRLKKGREAKSAVSILAELMRLRRAACDPRLVDPDVSVGCAKLDRFVELVLELREGGHRALVFSQFVDFLTLAGERLRAAGVTYQYLDGSSSESARKNAVVAFQGGEGDLFLISLKAGGFGLNLTAADYVIHLDPWWNPAVERQASDRAHRIGQERPVTVYRLVTAGSVEERVLSLHERKQALAEELLRESSEAPRLDPALLLSLLEA